MSVRDFVAARSAKLAGNRAGGVETLENQAEIQSVAVPFPCIAALQPSVSVTLAGLRKLDHLVACTKWCVEQVPELVGRGLTILPDSWSAAGQDMATLRSANPDIVIACVPYQQAALTAMLKSGVPVLAFAPRSLAEIYADTRMLAALVNAREEAEAMVGEFQQTLADYSYSARAHPVNPPRRIHAEEWGKPIIHSQPWVNELISACGGEAIGLAGVQTSAEQIATDDPDVLLMAWCGAGDRVPLERVVEQRGWQQLRAAEERRVYCIPDEFLNTPAIPALRDGLACIAHCLQPEKFAAPERLRRIR